MRSGVIMASGSEVQLAVQARDLLQAPRSKMSIWTRRKLSSGVSGWPRHAPPKLAAQTLREIRTRNLVPGRKSLGGEGKHSPVIQFRGPAHLRDAVEARAQAGELSVSGVARRALESYLAEHPADESGPGGGGAPAEPELGRCGG
jgi:hypothetical protein